MDGGKFQLSYDQLKKVLIDVYQSENKQWCLVPFHGENFKLCFDFDGVSQDVDDLVVKLKEEICQHFEVEEDIRMYVSG